MSTSPSVTAVLEDLARTLPPPAFLLLYALITCIPFPGTRLFAIGAGALYGPLLGFALVYGGALLGASCGFLGSRHLFGKRLEPWARGRFPKAFEEADANVIVYLWSLRLSPLFSFALVHYVMGMTRVDLLRFLGVTAVCSFLYSALYVTLGGVLASADGVPFRWLLAFFVLSLIPLAFRRKLARTTKEIAP